MDALEQHCKLKNNTKMLGIREFAVSALFCRLFEEGIALVEEATHWMEGPGRGISKSLSRDLALRYVSRSLDMTARLMQTATWLVTHRAIADEKFSVQEIERPQFRIPIPDPEEDVADDLGFSSVFADIYARTQKFHARIYRLDRSMHGEKTPMTGHPLAFLQESRQDGKMIFS